MVPCRRWSYRVSHLTLRDVTAPHRTAPVPLPGRNVEPFGTDVAVVSGTNMIRAASEGRIYQG